MDEIVNFQLLHGHASLSAAFEELRQHGDLLFEPGQVYDEDRGDNTPANVIAAQWFVDRKRALLAPFGVGTVDQALLAALQTRHVFVRLFGLASKTIIIDEAHAYDTYMTTLLARLIEWLGALGAPVVLLSATLPQQRRQALLEAYAKGAGWTLPPMEGNVSYPRLSWTSAAASGAKPVLVSPRATRDLAIKWVDGQLPTTPGMPFPLGEQLHQALAEGGCATVICNTVRRAQEVYQALEPYFSGPADDGEPQLDLLHARFLWEERERREARVVQRFGKVAESAHRPHRAVLVATQIIEQSLDLDFDLMVTDHAPVDLVLQRAGRLQRHERTRPAAFEGKPPTLWICAPEDVRDSVPDFGRGTQAVYDGHVLLRSWLALHDRATVAIPGDVEALIEAVYDERACPPDFDPILRQRWEKTLTEQRKVRDNETHEARQRYIRHPGFGGELAQLVNQPREEDAPELHSAHQALTRLIEPTVSLICLPGPPEHPLVDGKLLDMRQPPTVSVAKRLLRRVVTVADRRIVHALRAQEAPKSWRRSALLRNHRLVTLDEMDRTLIGRYELRIDPRLGLVISEVGGGTHDV